MGNTITKVSKLNLLHLCCYFDAWNLFFAVPENLASVFLYDVLASFVKIKLSCPTMPCCCYDMIIFDANKLLSVLSLAK